MFKIQKKKVMFFNQCRTARGCDSHQSNCTEVGPVNSSATSQKTNLHRCLSAERQNTNVSYSVR